MTIHALDIGEREISAPDPGLVGDNEKFEARVLESFQRAGRAGINRDVLDLAEIIFLSDQRPIAIQKNGSRHAPRFQQSAGE
jgi:hypothetical protein